MKTKLLVALLASFTLHGIAQEVAIQGPAAVYEAPVIYQAPVLYQLPVVYLAPVYYLNPACAMPTEPDQTCCNPSVVVFIGGKEGPHAYAHCGTSASTVFHFGAEQACAYGYRFNTPR